MHCLVVFGRPVIVFRLGRMSPCLVTKVGSNDVNLDKWTEHTYKSSNEKNDQIVYERRKFSLIITFENIHSK